jgi:tRNA threonylcarbamoyladenosine biosynthesis protein TsaB
MTTLLAFDTATERMSIGLVHGTARWQHEAAAGAAASAALIPAVLDLLAQAGLTLRHVDAIAFGRGPGAFTGLRTACAAAQGLAFGAGKPVLPVDTLLAVAEDARGGAAEPSIWVAMDARMNEIYAAHYVREGGRWSTRVAPFLCSADALNERWREDPPALVAGSALAAFEARLDARGARLAPLAAPRPAALLTLAESLWGDGGAVDASLALPLYVRDKVAHTTAERDAMRAAPREATALP